MISWDLHSIPPCQMGGFRLENKPDSWWILKTRKLSSQLGPFLQKQVQQPKSAFPSNVLFRYEGRVIRFWSSILRQLWSIKMVSKTNSQTIYLCQVSVENMSNVVVFHHHSCQFLQLIEMWQLFWLACWYMVVNFYCTNLSYL